MDIIGFQELLLIAFVALLVIGPERLPETLRTMGLWLGRLRRSFTAVKTELEKEIGMDDIRRQLHNEAVMEEMKRIERDVQNSVQVDGLDANSIMGPDATPNNDSTTAADATSSDAADDSAATEAAKVEAQAESDAEQATVTAAADGVAVQESTEPSAPITAQDTLEPEPPLPRSEAELEALHERRRRAQEQS